MTDDLLRQLREFQGYAASLQALLAEAQAGLVERAVGADHSGAVAVTLGPDGLPETARVETDWLRRLPSSRFTDAVTEASQVAATARLKRWARTLNDNSWRFAGGIGSARTGLLADNGRDAGAGRQPYDRAAASQLVPSPDLLIEDVLAALHSVERIAARTPLAAQGTGANRTGQLTVTVSRSSALSCTAAPRWLSQQSGAALTRALNEAFEEARDDLAQAAAAAAGAQLDPLFADALALLGASPDLPQPRRTA